MTRHLHEKLLRGGSVGVDIFFVISGFVITRLLLQRRDSSRLSLRNFYWSRWTRLMPALATMVVLTCVVMAFGGPTWHRDLNHSPLALFYVMDFYRAAAPAGSNVGGIFGHTWSLGVEEQFYLLWPLLLLVLLKRVSIRRRPQVIIGVCGLLLLERFAFELAGRQFGNRIFNAPDTRFDQLLVGCLVAVIAWQTGGFPANLLSIASKMAWPAMAGLLAVAAVYNPDVNTPTVRWTFPLMVTATAVLAGIVVVCAAFNEQHSLTRCLSSGPLLFVGMISYSLYLWHYPIIHLLLGKDVGSLSGAGVVAAVVLSFAAAVVSWWQIEQRFHRGSVAPAMTPGNAAQELVTPDR